MPTQSFIINYEVINIIFVQFNYNMQNKYAKEDSSR